MSYRSDDELRDAYHRARETLTALVEKDEFFYPAKSHVCLRERQEFLQAKIRLTSEEELEFDILEKKLCIVDRAGVKIDGALRSVGFTHESISSEGSLFWVTQIYSRRSLYTMDIFIPTGILPEKNGPYLLKMSLDEYETLGDDLAYIYRKNYPRAGVSYSLTAEALMVGIGGSFWGTLLYLTGSLIMATFDSEMLFYAVVGSATLANAFHAGGYYFGNKFRREIQDRFESRMLGYGIDAIHMATALPIGLQDQDVGNIIEAEPAAEFFLSHNTPK